MKRNFLAKRAAAVILTVPMALGMLPANITLANGIAPTIPPRYNSKTADVYYEEIDLNDFTYNVSSEENVGTEQFKPSIGEVINYNEENKAKVNVNVEINGANAQQLKEDYVRQQQEARQNQSEQLEEDINESTPMPLNEIGAISNISVDGNVVNITLQGQEKIKATFLTDKIFRLNLEPKGAFVEEPDIFPNDKNYTGKILVKPVSEWEGVTPTLVEEDDCYLISTEAAALKINKADSTMSLTNKKTGKLLWEEAAPLKYENGTAVQTLKTNSDEYFYGGGMQNGYFSHKGKTIRAAKHGSWVHGDVTSPNPFYVSTNGYGAMRYTWKTGLYDFGDKNPNIVTTMHNEERFDAFYFVGDTVPEVINGFTDVTGKIAMLPEYAYYLGHLNAYNRDWWDPVTGSEYQPHQLSSLTAAVRNRLVQETLNDDGGKMPKNNQTNGLPLYATGTDVANGYIDNDMPLGYFLPNDGYGAGYGQTDSLEGDIQNLKKFTETMNTSGIETGLWTQSDILPADPNNPKKGERDINKEVGVAGTRLVKTDVAWVGAGYAMALDAVQTAAKGITENSDYRPFIVSLNGWAGTQRFAGLWSGDQYGGNWEYIRFHIPTYIGSGLSGNPNVGSDMDGIFGGSKAVQVRDYQWKTFTPIMLDMDGWGSYRKLPHNETFNEPNISINRMYLKLKAQLMPYLYSIGREAYETSNPMMRAMFLEFPEDKYLYGTQTQYQYMYGPNFLVAPIYNAEDNNAGVRNDIYLPDSNQTWIDYFTGVQYKGGGVISLEAPLWKLPLLVKNGAIIPMTVENDTPMREGVEDERIKVIPKDAPRIFEVYPSGSTEFTLYEDDGYSERYKTGSYAQTKITSEAPITGTGTATITVSPAEGNYSEINKDHMRGTEFIVNVQQQPSSVSATINGSQVSLTGVSTQEEFDAGNNVYLYNSAPDLNKFADALAPIITTPKLYVKVEKANVTSSTVVLTVDGFNNTYVEGDDGSEQVPQIPASFGATDENITPTSILLQWNKQEDVPAKYEIHIVGNGLDYYITNISGNSYFHKDLPYGTEYTYSIRAFNSRGSSEWSEPVSIETKLDPYRNVPPNLGAKLIDASGRNVPGNSSSGEVIENAVDNDNGTQFHSVYGYAVKFPADLIIDMQQVYKLDKFEHIPRDGSGNSNGVIRGKVKLSVSIDGKHWNTVADEVDWNGYGAKLIELQEQPWARYVKLTVNDAVGNFIAGKEFRPYKVDGTTSMAPGDSDNKDGVIDDKDLLQLSAYYMGCMTEDSLWGQIQHSDLNYNGIIDIYDAAFVTRQLEGGVVPKNTFVSGELRLEPSKTEVAAGEEFTVSVIGKELNDIYAFDLDIPFDSSKYELLELPQPTEPTQNMRHLSRLNPDKTLETQASAKRLYVGFANVGNKPTVTTTGNEEVVLSTFKVKAKQNLEFDMTPSFGNLVTSNLRVKDALNPDADNPDLSDPEALFPQIVSIVSKDANGNVIEDQPGTGIDNAIDKDEDSVWHSKWYQGVTMPATVELELEKYYNIERFDYVINKASTNGRPLKVDFEYLTYDGEWVKTNQNVEWEDDTTTKSLNLPKDIWAKKFRVIIKEVKKIAQDNFVTAAEFKLLKAENSEGMDTPPGALLIKGVKFGNVYQTVRGTEEFVPVMDQPGEERAKSLDGNPTTKWHSVWQTAIELPAYIEFDLGARVPFASLEYMPRQDGGFNGMILKFDFLYWDEETNDWVVAKEGVEWARSSAPKYIELDEGVTTDRVMLKVLSSVGGQISDQSGDTGYWNETAQKWHGYFLSASSFKFFKAEGTQSEKSSNANLGSLSIQNSLELKPEFSPSVTEYEVKAPNSTVPNVTYATQSIYATAEVIKATSVPGTTVIKVTAEDGTIKEYKVNFVRDENPLTLLRNVSIIKATNSSGFEVPDQPGEGRTNALDGDENTFWHSKWEQPALLPVSVVFDLKKQSYLGKFEYVPRQDNSSGGSFKRIALSYSTNGTVWSNEEAVPEFAQNNETKVVNLNRTSEARYVKITVLDTHDGPDEKYLSAAEFRFFELPEAPEKQPEVVYNITATALAGKRTAVVDQQGHELALAVDGDEANGFWHSKFMEDVVLPVDITLSTEEPTEIKSFEYVPRQDGNSGGNILKANLLYSVDGQNWTSVASDVAWANDSTKKSIQFPTAVTAKFVKLVVTDSTTGVTVEGVNGNFVSAAEFKLISEEGTTLTGLKISAIGSSKKVIDQQNHGIEKAFDGIDSGDEHWHTDWFRDAGLPVEIVMDLNQEYGLTQFEYVPRQDGGKNGMFKVIDAFTSMDGESWAQIAEDLEWTNDTSTKTIPIPTTYNANNTARYLKIVVKDSYGGNSEMKFLSAAEIRVVGIAGSEAPVGFATLNVSEASAVTGEEVSINVSLVDNPGLSGMRFKLNYDKSKLTPVSYSAHGTFGGNSKSNMDEPNVVLEDLDFVSFVWASATNVDDKGQVLTIKFKVKEGVAPGEIPITVTHSEDDISDEDGNEILLYCVNGAVIVEEEDILFGDVTQDGVINAKDLVLLMQHVAKWNGVKLTEKALKAANTDGLNGVDTADVVRLLQYLAEWQVNLGR